ncbi:MAG TPA: nucleotidyltransferase domain-containing protein [Blastocatellia bacterium]|nr:nucleotidyltransferase domain-containing protein [Blastocatellia bacterium]
MSDVTLNISHIVTTLTTYFSQRAEVGFAYLFGSVAGGRAGRLSDLDIAIFVDTKMLTGNYPYGYRASLITDLMKILGTSGIDLVVLNTAPPSLRFRVIRYGKLIFSRSDSERIAFHVRTLAEYNDLRPLWRVHDRYISQRIRQGRFGWRD